MEILPALQAAEQEDVFKGAAIHPYYLKKAAYNPDRPHENNDWGEPPKERSPARTTVHLAGYHALAKRSRALGVFDKHMKGPELEAAIRKAENEQRQNESEAGSVPGHEGLPGQGGEVAQTPEGGPDQLDGAPLATADQE